MRLALCEEPVRDTTLIERLDGASVKTPGSRPVEILAGASFDDDDVDTRQHEPGRAASRDQYCMLCHRRSPANAAPDRDRHLAQSDRAPTPVTRILSVNSSTGSARSVDPSAEGNTRIQQLLAS
jgi:hypothetical protein